MEKYELKGNEEVVRSFADILRDADIRYTREEFKHAISPKLFNKNLDINLVMIVYDSGIYKKLFRMMSGEECAMISTRKHIMYVESLKNEFGLQEEMADRALRLWYQMGIRIRKEKYLSREESFYELIGKHSFYLGDIISIKKNIKDVTVNILKARGFLLETIDGEYFLSDNASIEDYNYLKNSLKKYSLGKIIESKEYIDPKLCKQFGDGSSKINRKVEKGQIKIVVNERTTLENLLVFFSENQRIGSEGCVWNISWDRFVSEFVGKKPPVKILEGYVAFYVKAITECGVYTSYSCDGNHIRGGKIYVYADRPTDIWHEYLWKYAICRKFGDVPFIGDGIAFNNEEEKKEVYQLVYMIADYLYNHKDIILRIKEKTVQNLSKEVRMSLSDEEIESYYRSECQRVFSDESTFAEL